MILSKVRELLNSNSIPFSEIEFVNKMNFLNQQYPYTTKVEERKSYVIVIQSNNSKKNIELEFKERNGELIFYDLWFGDFSFEYFSDDKNTDYSYLIEEIQEIMKGSRTSIRVTNPITKRWIADAQFVRNDTDVDMFGELGFQKAMKRIQKKKTFFERLFRLNRKYEIYDWNTYECIIK